MTLCWKCGNADTNGCSWAYNLTPVDGWVKKNGVCECPLYTPKKKKWEMDNNATKLLCAAIVKEVAKEYLSACRFAVKFGQKPRGMFECERFFKSEYADVITDVDPLYIMNCIRKEAGLEIMKGDNNGIKSNE